MTDRLPVVHMRHAREIRRPGGRRLCVSGIEAWCARHGVDPRALANEGVPGEVFEKIGDTYAVKVIELARRELGNGQQ